MFAWLRRLIAWIFGRCPVCMERLMYMEHGRICGCDDDLIVLDDSVD